MFKNQRILLSICFGVLFFIVMLLVVFGKTSGFDQMVYDVNLYSTQSDVGGVLGAIAGSYVCYASVMGEGVKLWLNGKQSTPWANYFFKPETFRVPEEMSEPFSEDLLKANRLDDEDEEQDIFGNYQKNQTREIGNE